MKRMEALAVLLAILILATACWAGPMKMEDVGGLGFGDQNDELRFYWIDKDDFHGVGYQFTDQYGIDPDGHVLDRADWQGLRMMVVQAWRAAQHLGDGQTILQGTVKGLSVSAFQRREGPCVRIRNRAKHVDICQALDGRGYAGFQELCRTLDKLI